MTDVVETRLTRANVIRYQMPLKRAYGTARGLTTAAINFVVQLTATRGSTTLEGVGECQPRHSLTGDGGKDRAAAWRFLCAAADQLQGSSLRFADRDEAIAAIRQAMSGLHELAAAHADASNRDRPFRGTLLGIEIALLDIAARALGLQIAELLGKQRDEIGISISTISSSTDLAQVPEKVIKQARFPMTRVKGVGDIPYDLALLETVTRANRSVGREKPLWIDINEALDFNGATQLVRQIAERMGTGALPASLVMEGILPKPQVVDLPQLQRIADEECESVAAGRVLDLRIMPDEGLWDVTDFNRLAELGGCRAINIKAPKAGGLLASLDLANAAVAADPDIHICIGGMVGTSDLTAWALHNLARALPRVDYLTTVPPQNVEERITEPLARYQEPGSNLIASQVGPGLGARLRLDKLTPYVRVSRDSSETRRSEAATVRPVGIRQENDSPMPTRTLVFAGDTSLGDTYLNRKGGTPLDRLYDEPMSFFEGVRGLVSGHDALIVNLETVLADSPVSPLEGKKSYLGWDSPDRTIKCLSKLGVSAAGLANNHTMDFGAEHLLATRDLLKRAGISAFGAGTNRAEAAAPLTLCLDFAGTERRVHILGAMQLQSRLRDEYQFYAGADRPGVHAMALTRVTSAIETLRADDPTSLIIVFPHWGRNYEWINEARERAARIFAEAGADLVIGHGSHMFQQCSFGADRAAIYSLGNFVFNSRGRFRKLDAPPFGLVSHVELGLRAEGWKVDLRLYPILVDNNLTDYRPRPVDDQEFEAVWAELTSADNDGSFASHARRAKDRLGNHISYSLSTKPAAAAGGRKRVSRRSGWSAAELRRVTGGTWASEPKTPMERVQFVARWARPGRMLLTMEPEHWPQKQRRESAGQEGLDARAVAQLAADAGATALMTSTRLVDPPLPTLLVDDTRRALWQIAQAARAAYEGTMIGITGTVGKSTTKEMLGHVLKAEGPTLASSGNWNTIDGVAMVVAGLASAPDFAVVEAALSGFVMVPELTSGQLIQPHCAIVTAIGVAHANHAPTHEATAEHKGKLLHELKPGGSAVINTDTPCADYLIRVARENGAEQVLTFGSTDNADFRLVGWSISGGGCVVHAIIEGRRIDYRLSAPGRGMALNSLATLAAVKALGLSVDSAIPRLESVPTGSRVLDRQEILAKGGSATLIDDSKNAADLSMIAAFELLGRLGDARVGRKIAVLGNIAYLADAARETHASLADPLLAAGVDRVFTTGTDMEGLRERLPKDVLGPHAASPEELAAIVQQELRAGDVVLVKGSHRNTGFRRVADLLREQPG